MQKKRKKPAEEIVQPVPQNSALLYLILSTLVLSLVIASIHRNRAFKSPVTLWADASSKSVNKRRTHENYGQALSAAGMYSEAIREFKTVLALKDDGSVPLRDLYREIGVVYFRTGLIDDSITAWETGLRYAPFDASLLNNLSIAFLRQNRFDEAEKTIRQALVAAPHMPQALNSLGEILMVKGNYEEALKYFIKAVEVSPHVPSRYWNVALALERTGRYDMALNYANRYAAMETNPDLKRRAMTYIKRLQTLYSPGRKP